MVEHREYGWSNNKMVSLHHHFHSPRGRLSENGWENTCLPTSGDSVSSIQKSINRAEQTVLSTRCDSSVFIPRSVCMHRHTFFPLQRKSFPPPSPLTVSGKVILHSHFKTLSSFHTISGWAGQKIRGASVKCLMGRNSYLLLLILRSDKRELWFLWGRLIIIIYFKKDLLYDGVQTFSNHF